MDMGMDRAQHRVAVRDGLAGLILEQVDGVGGMVPEQMVGPAPRIARCVDILAPEEIGLHVHLLDLQLALLDLLVDVLVARVEAPHVAAHRGDAGFLRDLHQRLGVLNRVGDRDFDQHVLAGAHYLLALAEVHLGGRGEDHRVGALDALGEVAAVVRHAVFLGDLRRGVLVAADERGDFDVGDALERVEMLLAECALPGDTDFHDSPLIAK